MHKINAGKYKLVPVKGYESFSEIYSNAKKYYTKKASAAVIFRNEDEANDGIINFGVTISKRVAGKAVLRNRIKRLLRESFRLIAKEEVFELSEIKQIILLWRIKPISVRHITLNDVYPEVKKLLYKMIMHRNEVRK